MTDKDNFWKGVCKKYALASVFIDRIEQDKIMNGKINTDGTVTVNDLTQEEIRKFKLYCKCILTPNRLPPEIDEFDRLMQQQIISLTDDVSKANEEAARVSSNFVSVVLDNINTVHSNLDSLSEEVAISCGLEIGAKLAEISESVAEFKKSLLLTFVGKGV